MNVVGFALIIANGAACSERITRKFAENASLVLVLDGAIERVKQLGIIPAYVLGDFDRNLRPENFVDDRTRIVYTPDQEKTDLEKGIDFLIREGHSFIRVIWATGLRADHTITNLTNLARYRNKADVHLFDDYSHVFLLPYKFERNYPEKKIISLIPIGKVDHITTEGLVYNLKNETLTLGYRTGSSNEASAHGPVKISYETGDLLMMECND